MPTVAIALGSNLGDRHAHLEFAVDRLWLITTRTAEAETGSSILVEAGLKHPVRPAPARPEPGRSRPENR